MLDDTSADFFVVEKYFEPEEAPDYAASLARLPGDEEDLTPTLPLILKRREMTEQDARAVARRPHVRRVTRDYTVSAPPQPDVAADAPSATMEQVRAYHGFGKAYARNLRGQGRKPFVLDTGISAAWSTKIGGRLRIKESMLPGESWEDTNSGHGTWCGVWIALGAPEAEIGSIKVLSTKSGAGSMSTIAKAVDRAVGLGATEINLSLGGAGGPDDPLSRAVNAARALGVLVPCAAGNEQRGRTDFTADDRSPGCARGALTVACGDLDGALADFSSWGNSVDIRGMGVNSESGDLDGSLGRYMSGTSMITPVVTTACAVLGSGRGREVADMIEKALLATTKDTGLPPYQEGLGIMDVEFAAAKIVGLRPPVPKTGLISKSAFDAAPASALIGSDLGITSRGKVFGHFRGAEIKGA